MGNETLNTIYTRTSLRDFSSEKITTEEENAIIEAALNAPTAGNQTLYSMIIIRSEEKKNALSDLCDNQSFMRKAAIMIVFVADQHRWFDYYRMNGVKEFCQRENLKYADSGLGDLVLAFEDTMIAAQNSVIAAESMGIGSCYIGDILENHEKVRELLNLPKETFPLGLLCFGKYKDGYKKVHTPRFDKKYIVFDEEYKQLTPTEYKEMFKDREERLYFAKNKWNADNFAQQFFARKMASPFRHEMNRSVEAGLKIWNK